MSFEPREYLRHMLAETDYIVSACEGLSVEEFRSDPTRQRAFVRARERVRTPHTINSSANPILGADARDQPTERVTASRREPQREL